MTFDLDLFVGNNCWKDTKLGTGGNSNIFVIFTAVLGKIPILTIIFFKGVVQPARKRFQGLHAYAHRHKRSQ